MKFTTLDLSAELGKLYTQFKAGFDDLGNAQKVQRAQAAEKACRDEIDRQMAIYLKEEQAYVDTVKKDVANMKRLHDAALKDLQALEKLKHKSSNEAEIRKLHERIDQAYLFCASANGELDKMGAALTAHQDFRANPIPDELAEIMGEPSRKALVDHFTKGRAPAIGWIAGVKGVKDGAEQIVKRLKLMAREAAVFASDATDTGKVGDLIASELEKLFKEPNGPIATLKNSYDGIETQLQSNIKDIGERAKGKQKFVNRKEFEGYVRGQKFNVEQLGAKLKAGLGVLETARTRLDAVLKLSKKAPLTEDQARKVDEADIAIKAAAKTLKSTESTYTKFVKAVEKELPKIEAPD